MPWYHNGDACWQIALFSASNILKKQTPEGDNPSGVYSRYTRISRER